MCESLQTQTSSSYIKTLAIEKVRMSRACREKYWSHLLVKSHIYHSPHLILQCQTNTSSLSVKLGVSLTSINHYWEDLLERNSVFSGVRTITHSTCYG